MFRFFKKKTPKDQLDEQNDARGDQLEQPDQHDEMPDDQLEPSNQSDEIQDDQLEQADQSYDMRNDPAFDDYDFDEFLEQAEQESSEKVQPEDMDAFIASLGAPQPFDSEALYGNLQEGLSKTGSSITEGMEALVLGKKEIDEEVLEELETRLLMADVGMDATMRIIDDLTARSKRHELADSEALMKAMSEEMTQILQAVDEPLEIDAFNKPMVILMVGINGAGKTTTIGKLAKKFQNDGKSVMLAAGDTFRAAAVEQLQVWGERNDIPVVAQGTGADSASVIYDAMESANARNIDVLLADTAGRLHTQTNLMEELKKVKRVMQKIDPSSPHEVMLVIDAGIGQNALAQAKEFNNALGLTGITVTKLDGTAKGGILFAIAEQTGIPVRFIGVGESIDDLQQFDAYEFTSALLAESS